MRFIALAAIFLALSARAGEPAAKRRRPPPQEYGRVVLDNHSSKSKMAPVVFDHWLHRARYTCRVCHVDIGFAQQAGATDIRAADNAKGMYCGACHDDRTRTDGGGRVFGACSTPINPGLPSCARCHQDGSGSRREYDFTAFTKDLPRGRFGNGVDWELAETKGLVKPVDFVERVSIKRQAISAQKDFALSGKLAGMPDIIFSHAKHTVWSGCEGCHPDIFVGVKKGATKYTMVDIFQGRSCGVCHASVAFPTIDCQRCHSKPVQ
jgi:c(7)-type cytochrome triheme protein